MSTLTVKDALLAGTTFLERHDIATPRLDAELLLAFAFQCDRVHLYVEAERPIMVSEQERLRELLVRRAHHEPIAYIIGVKEFYGHPFHVTPAVLIPRPETETLVEYILAWLAEWEKTGPSEHLTLLDVGTGSGCIGCSVALHHDRITVRGRDVSKEALQVATDNAARLGLAGRVRMEHGSWLDKLTKLDQPTLLVSNPPYIPHNDLETLALDIIDFEPHGALDGGDDGCDPYRVIIKDAATLWPTLSCCVLEVAPDGEKVVRDIAREYWPHAIIGTVHDLAGIPRAVVVTTLSHIVLSNQWTTEKDGPYE